MPPNLAEDASCGRALAEVHILFPKVLLYHIISRKAVALNIQPHWVQLRLFSNPSLFVHHTLMEKQCHFFSIITFNNNHFFVVINDMLSNKTEVYKKNSLMRGWRDLQLLRVLAALGGGLACVKQIDN